MLKGYLTLDFGQSFFKDKPVVQLLWEKNACFHFTWAGEYFTHLSHFYSAGN